MKGRPSLSQIEAVDLILKQNYSCAVCKDELLIQIEDGGVKNRLKAIHGNDPERLYRLPLDKLHLHHKLPRSAGGRGLQNVEIVCENCTKRSQRSITLPDSVWKILDDAVRKEHGDKSNIGMRRGRRLRHIILDYVDRLDSEE
jgi:hypothetical protein